LKIYGSIPEHKPQFNNLDLYFELYPAHPNISFCSFFMDNISQIQFLKMSSGEYMKCL